MMKTEGPSIHLTLYAYGDIAAPCITSWIDMTTELVSSKRPAQLRLIREDALISRSRCRATSMFLQSGMDVWVQLDHDIQFSPHDIERLVDAAHTHQAAVCIPYSCRSLPPRPALRPMGTENVEPLPEDRSLKPILFFASGAVAIPRAALIRSLEILQSEATPHPYRVVQCSDNTVGTMHTLWMPFALECDKGTDYLSEDYAASARLALCGVPQLSMEPVQKLQHWGDFNFRL